jgi:hypothetical protein
MASKTKTSGFAPIAVVNMLLVVVLVAFGGWYVWKKSQDSKALNNSQQQNGNSDSPDASPDSYADWKTYSNDVYGFSFKYPTDWGEEDVDGSGTAPSVERPLTVRFAANVKGAEDVKYNDTVTVQVLNNDLNSASTALDREFAQSSLNKVAKTTQALKGKQGVQYLVANGNGTVKTYLFAVGDKAYEFSSINEEFNVQEDADYWLKFDKIFESFRID